VIYVNNMTYFCSVCKRVISDDVYRYSRSHYSVALCRDHQQNPEHQTTQSIKSTNKKPEPTPEARRLGELLKKYGYKVEYEKYDGYKHIDIAIVNKKVNIEVDGGQHHGKEQALRDLKRTFYSWDKNYVTLRIPNSLTRDDETIRITAEYIDRFLRKDRTQLEKEIKQEYIEEGNPFWEDINNFINDVGEAWDNVSRIIKNRFS
jgi:very-short-patch-repair endonuclease